MLSLVPQSLLRNIPSTESDQTSRTRHWRLAIGASVLVGAALGLLLAPNDVLAEETDAIQLEFGVYSANKPSAMVRVFKPALKRIEYNMSEALGQPVDIRMQIAKDYDQGIEDLATGRVDFSQFGPASYIEARRVNPDLQILAMESIEKSKVFYGIIAVHTDSDIQTLEDLRGRSFAFGDQGSTIGRFLSQLHLEQNDIRAGDLAMYDYLGRHDKVGTAVGAGDYDAGALNEKTFKKLVEAGEPLRELARFSNVTKPWIASSTLEPRVVDALRAALLSLDDAKALASLKVDGFFESTDTDYDIIRMAIAENDRFFDERAPVRAAGEHEHLDASVTVEQSEDTLRLSIGVPSTLFDSLTGAESPRVQIELHAEPAAAAAQPAIVPQHAHETAQPDASGDGVVADD